ncbi:hypothetical protein BBBOND_0106560 [Babesia bigemina]|uniref:Uncharacterized protein n=1 Tax=Babesia bigemina TaxID=5866 RepID=A0A061D2Q1_BABBI|nr:hypothetical protein BBBOND_0106560 [Babesia bigemina]CDR94347.1 hypothetical protein BBBOND_0106560 [Babesia bigemina]|eukprot:XP_012766533.1 hypothetical protein BBBOND_0106560 [Babesia bigemina]
MAVSAAENEQTYQAVSDSTDCNSHAKHNEDGNEGMLMDISEMKATVEDKMETRESLQDISEMKATLKDMREMMASLKDISEMKATLKDMREMMASLKDMREMKEIAETIKSLVHLLQRGVLHKDVVAPCVLKTPHPDGGAGTSPSGGGQQQLCSAPPQLQHASLQAQSVKIPETCVVKKSPNLTAHQQVVYNSLIYVPRNFKEAIDWLIAVRGDDAEGNLAALGAAIYDLYVHMSGRSTEWSNLDKAIRFSIDFLEQEKLKKHLYVKMILFLLDERLRVTPNILTTTVVSEDDTKNENHYKSAYSPQATWDPLFSAHPKTSALMLELIQALGYVEPECRAGMTASYVGDALEGFEETIIFLYELAGFWAFY